MMCTLQKTFHYLLQLQHLTFKVIKSKLALKQHEYKDDMSKNLIKPDV